MHDAVTAFAPGSIGNVGPGLDVLGLAVAGRGDEVTLTRDGGPGLRVSDAGDPGLPTDPARHAAAIAARAVFKLAGFRDGVTLAARKGLPLSGGQGGSAASAVAGAVAANALCRGELSTAALLSCALVAESTVAGRHADNLAPSLLGGLVLIRSLDPIVVLSVPVPDGLHVVLVHPHQQLATRRARAVLPDTVPRAVALSQLAAVATMIAAAYRGDVALFGRAIDDGIAEPARAPLLPGFLQAKAAALAAGAFGCSISGAGPTAFAITNDAAAGATIGSAMVAAYAAHGIDGDRSRGPGRPARRTHPVKTSTRQECEECGHRLAELDAAERCPRCDGLVAVMHDITGDTNDLAAELKQTFAASGSPSGVWRYGAVVLPSATGDVVSHPEGNTPLLQRDALCRWTGVDGLLLKHEGQNPTGSFKDRGMTVGMTQARRIGARAVACASTGNTSASLASYAAHAGIPALAIVPDGQVTAGKLAQTLAYGAHTLLIDGDFDACLRLMREASAELGVYLLNSVNPFRIEGQKTIVFEMLDQLDWHAPDWIALPAGNLGNTAAFGKALREARAWGLIDRVPRIAAVQAAGAAPFAHAFEHGFDALEPVQADTLATAIKIGAPASYRRAVRAIRETNGVVLAVSDAEILAAKVAVDRSGVGCEPASAASVAGVRTLRQQGTIAPGDSVVAVLTGHVLKDVGVLERLHGDESIAPALANAPIRIAPTVAAVQEVLVRVGGG